jgi:hypothetical protein
LLWCALLLATLGLLALPAGLFQAGRRAGLPGGLAAGQRRRGGLAVATAAAAAVVTRRAGYLAGRGGLGLTVRLRGLRMNRGRLHGPLVLGHDRRCVDRGRGGVRAGRQGRLPEHPDGRVAVRRGAHDERADRLPLVLADRLGTDHQLHVGPQVRLTDLHDVVALLPQGAGDRPVALDGDVQDRHPETEVLDVGDDLRQVLLRAHDQRVADGVVARQRGQVAVDLALDAFPAAWPHPAEPEFHTRQICQRVVLGGTAAFHGSLVPVAPQQRRSCPVSGDVPEELEDPRVVPRHGLTVAGSVYGHRAIRQHVASVNEQRTAIHGHRPSVNARRYQRTVVCVMVRAQIAGRRRLR